jgi:hypothetical protein
VAPKYRRIDPRIWADERFRTLSVNERVIALYVLTSPQSNRIGLFHFSPAKAAEDLHLDLAAFGKAFKSVTECLRWGWDEAARVIYLPTWWKYNRPENPTHLLGCLTDLQDVPENQFTAQFRANIQWLDGALLDTFSERMSIPIPIGMAYQEQELEQELEQKQDSLFPGKRLVAAAGRVENGKATPKEIMEAWNAGPWRKFQSWSEDRVWALSARKRDPFFLANWRTALERLKASAFARGQNARGWVADIDFFLRTSTVAKIMEGRYEERTPVAAPVSADRAERVKSVWGVRSKSDGKEGGKK